MQLFKINIYGSATTSLIISNKEKEDIMKIVKSLEESRLLIKRTSETKESRLLIKRTSETNKIKQNNIKTDLFQYY